MSCVIREASISDSNILADLMRQLGYPTSSDKMLQQIKLYQNNQFNKVWVAELNDTVVGCLSVVSIDFFHRKTRSMRITSLIIDEQYRRMGIGRLLIETAESFAKKNECNFIELTSGVHRAKLGSHDFYESLGYKDLKDIKKYMAKKLEDIDPRFP